MMHAEALGEAPRTPVRRAVGRRAARPVENPGFHLRREHGRLASGVARIEPRQPVGLEAPLPLADEGLATVHEPGDLAVRASVTQQEEHPGHAGILRAAGATAGAPRQLRAFRRSERERLRKHALY